MSFSIDLLLNGRMTEVPNHCEGGTYALGGTTQASIDVTYNYSPFYYEHLDNEKGFRWLNGKTGEECVARLEAAVAVLGTTRERNYWKATPGNAGYALSILLAWAKLHPQAVFETD